jgi:hypothetical protein
MRPEWPHLAAVEWIGSSGRGGGLEGRRDAGAWIILPRVAEEIPACKP